MAGETRFVFVVSKPGDEVVDGSAWEIRAASVADAMAAARARCAGIGVEPTRTSLRLVGIRRGFRSDQRFIPLVPLEKVPSWIRQNERIGEAA